jgi:hypothetical protein
VPSDAVVVTISTSLDPPNVPVEEGKKRHGCLTVYLVSLVVLGLASALLFLLSSVPRYFPNAPAWAGPVLLVLSLVNLVWPIAMFRWKKWGFWGFCVSCVVGIAINIAIGMDVVESVSGFLGILVMYGVLRMGGEKNGWSQLE